MATTHYLIRCITNLHAGAGDETYGVIDKRVQRDVTTGRPTIFSSSLKGAFREFFVAQFYPDKSDKEAHDLVSEVFGSHHKSDKMKQGTYRFLSAKLYSLPVRSNYRPFYNATCPSIIAELLQDMALVDIELPEEDKQVLNSLTSGMTEIKVSDTPVNGQPILVERWKTAGIQLTTAEMKVLQKYFGEHIALMPDSQFIEACDALPVIARNQLENGESQNLWYEEVVPRESRFGFFIIHPDTVNNDFNTKLTNNNIQIGANATIGYGLTRIYKR